MSEETSPKSSAVAETARPKTTRSTRAAPASAKKAAARKPRAAKSADKELALETTSSRNGSDSAERPAEAPRPVVEPAPANIPPPRAEAPAPAFVAPTPSPASYQPSSPASEQQPAPQQSPQQNQSGEQQRFGGERDRRRDHRFGRNRHRNRDRDRDHQRDPQQQRDPHQGDQQQPRDQQPREPLPERPLGPPEPVDGILELSPKGYGFLRQRDRGYNQTPNDAFVSPEFIRKFGLREGMQIKGECRRGHRGPQVTEIAEVNARAPEAMRDLPLFEELKAINPNKRIPFETIPTRLTTRVIDLVTPVGRGQRGLIVAPPRAGKTTLLQHVAEAVTQLHPQMHLMILLVDERPEEVTEFKKLLPRAEIFASSNDMDVKSHTRICQFAIERAKRLCECGEHVFILLDSITRMARAFNNSKSGGATMSGGVGVGALEIPRRLFAAARNTRGAGSITILATALIETGSRMDDLIFQEFKGTGNMELVLDRRIAEQYVFPAVNVLKSGSRREELLIPAFQLEKIHMLRRGLAGHKPIEAMQRVISLLERYPSNNQMLVELPSKQS
jgi:transcription termination factor Rho